MSESDLLKEALEAFEACEEAEAENRADALDDIRFARLGEQWPPAVRRQRELDARPCQTVNVLPTYIRQVVNDGRQNRPSITVHPAADGADEEVADIYNGLIRNIEVTSDADVAYDTALDSAVTCGIGYFRINTTYASDDSFFQDLRIDAVSNPFSVWGDPYSTAADSSDWNTAFVVDSMRKSQFERSFKGAEASDWDAGYGNLPPQWMSGDMVTVAEYWKREQVIKQIVALSSGEIVPLDEFEENLDAFRAAGLTVIGQPRPVRSHKVTQYLLTGAEVLQTTPWIGKYIPIVPVYGEVVNLEGKRYLRSLVRDAKDPQRNINYMRSAGTEAIGLTPKAPFIGPKGAFATDADKWETANTDSHAFIEYDVVGGAGPPQRQPFPGVPAGFVQAVQDAALDLKTVIGLHDASMGAPSNESSGRAIMARMREGDVSTFHFTDNLSRAIRHAGRILIDLIPHVYSTPRIIRVMGQDGTPSQVPINQTFQQPQQQAGQPPQIGQAPQGQPGQGPPAGQPDLSPATIAKCYDLTAGKYDLTVEAGPSFTTRREEAANQMIELIRAMPEVAPLIGDLLVKSLDWPDADDIAERIVQARQMQQNPQGGEQAKVQAETQAEQMRIQAKAAAERDQLQQTGQLKMQQMQQEHELQLQMGQQQIELERTKAAAQLDIEREKMRGQMQLAQEKAAFDAQLAEQSMRGALAIKAEEARHNADETVEIPETTPGGGIG